MIGGILPKLTRDYVLAHIDEIDIWTYYTNISSTIIYGCVEHNDLICSPIRVDTKPTVGFYVDRTSKRLRMNDFAGYFHGDCFDLVAYIKCLDSTNKVDFAIILNTIAKDFGIHTYARPQSKFKIAKVAKTLESKPEVIIDIIEREWNYIDNKYWGDKYETDAEYLDHFNLKLVYMAYINNNLIYTFDIRDPCYAYTSSFKGKPQWKLNFPFRKKGGLLPRFLGNISSMMGLEQLVKAKIGLITKAIKDVIVLRTIGIHSVSVASESVLPTPEEIALIRTFYEEIYSLMDFDLAGIRLANKMKRLYGIQPIFITNGRFDTVNFGVKDASDFKEKYRAAKMQRIAVFMYQNRHDKTIINNYLKTT